MSTLVSNRTVFNFPRSLLIPRSNFRLDRFENVNCIFLCAVDVCFRGSEGSWSTQRNSRCVKANGIYCSRAGKHSKTKLHPKLQAARVVQRVKNVKALEKRSNWKIWIAEINFYFRYFVGYLTTDFFCSCCCCCFCSTFCARKIIKISMFNSCFSFSCSLSFLALHFLSVFCDWSAESFVKSLKVGNRCFAFLLLT